MSSGVIKAKFDSAQGQFPEPGTSVAEENIDSTTLHSMGVRHATTDGVNHTIQKRDLSGEAPTQDLPAMAPTSGPELS